MKKGKVFGLLIITFIFVVIINLSFIAGLACSITSSYSYYEVNFDCCSRALPLNVCTPEKQCWNCNTVPFGSVRCPVGWINSDCYGDCEYVGGLACCVPVTWYRDADADGYGTPATTTSACTKPAGYVSNGLDFNDACATCYPSATESCDGYDNDNNGVVDGITSTSGCTQTGACSGAYKTCSAGAWSSCSKVATTETCNSLDDDCDGSTDEGLTFSNWYRDADADGYGISTTLVSACKQPVGYVGTNTDCNDTNSSIKPGATELCDGKDNDCDGSIDEGGVCFANTWVNMNNEPITSANSGDTVLMKVAGSSSYLSGKTVNYTAYQGVLFWFDSRVAQSSTQGYAPFTIPSTGTFYFTTAVSGVSGTQTSGNLAVSGSDDSSPSASITSPSEGYYTSVNFPVNFAADISDADDLLMVTWDFGDGTADYVIYNYSTFLGSNASINHTYTASGSYDVTLTVSEMTRTNSTSVSKEVRVFGSGINVVPVISEPANGVSIGDNRLVNFSAALSFVANCSGGTMANKNFTAGNLNCSYIHAPNARAYSSNNYNITMNWTMTTEGSSEIINVYGDFVSNYNSVVVFQKDLEIRGVHTANLDMKYDSR